jgi:hypothetical protein
VHEIKYHDVVSSGIFAYGFPGKHPPEWPEQDLIMSDEAMEAYIVELIAASHFLKQQLIVCRH